MRKLKSWKLGWASADPVEDGDLVLEARLVVFLLCINDELGYFNEDIPRPLAGSLAYGERKRREANLRFNRHVLGRACSALFYWRYCQPFNVPFKLLSVVRALVIRCVSRSFRHDTARYFRLDMLWLRQQEFLLLPLPFSSTVLSFLAPTVRL